jgi:hypothetical protein
METLLSLTFWGWALVLFGTVLFFPMVAYERVEVGFFAIIIFFALAYWIWGFNVLLAIWNNPATVFISAILYFSAGGAWSIFRWWRFVADKRNDYDKRVESFCDTNNITRADRDAAGGIPEKYLDRWPRVSVPKPANLSQAYKTPTQVAPQKPHLKT